METLLNATVLFQFLKEGFYINLNWLGQFVKIIVESVGVVGVGIICFTLILKAITTPFDIYQRVTMRKQTLIMRGMKDDLDKLKKQYANDTTMYQLKMRDLQKKNGYSIFGSCISMIISLVIMIVAITAFQSYSQYANLSMYESMAHAYNASVMQYAADGKDYSLTPIEGSDRPVAPDVSDGSFSDDGNVYTLIEDGKRMQVVSEDTKKFLFYTYSLEETVPVREYYIDVDRMYENQTDEGIKAGLKALVDGGLSPADACVSYLHEIGSESAAEWFRDPTRRNRPAFLWVKNVWYPDVVYNHPIQEYSSFTGNFSRSKIYSSQWEGERSIGDVLPESDYNLLTSKLETEKSQANGYFIMILISIGLMLASQFITMRSQKESNEYQSADGSGARTQKVMMVAMPLMYAVFGFMWSAAFTIYSIVSSFLAIVMTLITNLILDRVFRRKEEEELKKRYTRTAPWKETGKKKK